jgi:hypothetical protein
MNYPEFCERCGCDVFECGGNVAGYCIRPDIVAAHELPPRKPSTLTVMIVDCIVWGLCAAFAGAVAVSYLIAIDKDRAPVMLSP